MAYINGKKVTNTIKATTPYSPKGAYASLTELIAAVPNGDSGIFVTTDNGHWYYYNNGWKDGGVYQAAAIADESITPEKTTFFDIERSSNRLDLTKITANEYMSTAGEVGNNEAYKYTDFIPVEEGETITLQIDYSSEVKNMRFVCAYDKNKNVLSGNGANSVNVYVVPSGVSYIVVTALKEYLLEKEKPRIVNSETIIAYEPYYIKHILKQEHINKKYIDAAAQAKAEETVNNYTVDLSKCNFTESLNLFNKDSKENKIGYYSINGVEGANPNYLLTHYMEVEPNTTYTFNSNVDAIFSYAEQYDSDKNYIVNTLVRDKHNITTVENAKYVRITLNVRVIDSACLSKGNIAIAGTKYEHLIPEKYILKETQQVEATIFIPNEIVVAVGRTIEIYNNQVCPLADKYHFNWVCSVGKNLKRKFSITGTTNNIGNYNLELEIYNDQLAKIYYKSINLIIVANLSNNVSICPIGDSLTNNKYWLNEVRNLSSNLISYVGTRGVTDGLKHEGRSGFNSSSYLTATEYTYESEGVHPFWDVENNAFSWAYYKATTGINPNMVQIFLGTNDIAGKITKEDFTNNIKTMIDSIRENDATIPILIVLTLCWGDQNGTGKQTNTDGFNNYKGFNSFEINSRTIQNLQYLYETINKLNYSNLYFVPVTQCHDSEYNFGSVETPVNPRAAQTELMPVEAVHPQQQGYEQMADIMYSVICKVYAE